MAFVLPSILLGSVMDKLLTGPENEHTDHQTFDQESGESGRDMAEDFAKWGREN